MTTHASESNPGVAPLTPAEAYERFAVPALFAPAADRLLATAMPAPGERVLDVGAGTGIVARRVAQMTGLQGTVTGLDASPSMLAVARAAAARDGLAIDWREGFAEQLPFPEASFDLVLSQFALMFFRDVPAALAEMRRVLVPDGRMALSVFQPIAQHPFYLALEEAIARQLGRSTVAAIFALGDGDALTSALTGAGFTDVRIEPWSLTAQMGPPESFLAGEIALDVAALPSMQDVTPAASEELIAAIADEMVEPLRAVTRDGEVIMPFQTLIVRAAVEASPH